jgi:hypothetical protein
MMRILNRSNIKIIAVLALLLIILLSIHDPLPEFASFSTRKLNLNKAVPYDCVAEHLPEGDVVTFFGNPYDADANPNLIALYYRAQFFLAPRILHLINLEQDAEMDYTGWLIGSNLDEQQIARISQEYQLEFIEACGNLTLFHQD